MELDDILKERGSRYGQFIDNATIAQALKDVMHKTTNWDALAADQKECLEMIAAKISRLLTGNPDYADSWQDIAGYAELVTKRLSEQDSVKST